MPKYSRMATVFAASVFGVFAGSIPAYATEGGTSMYPHGVEGFMAGALPPPGWYGMVYGNHYSADRVNDNNGKNLKIPGFKVTADVIAGHLVWVPGAKVFRGDLVLHTIVPAVNLKVNVPGASQTKTGIGDIAAGMGIGFHHSANLHSVIGFDLMLPTGGYSRGDIANIGKNHWGIEPVVAINYTDPKGFNGDIKMGYTINGRNRDTDYTSGHEFHFDYALGWGIASNWTLGLGGYFYKQITNDRQAGSVVANNKGSATSIGPVVKYDSGKGWFFTLKWEKEFEVKNRTQGSSVWFKAVFPL